MIGRVSVSSLDHQYEPGKAITRYSPPENSNHITSSDMLSMANLVTMPKSQNMENMAAVESGTGIIRGMKLNLLKSEYVSLKLLKEFDTSFVTSSSGTFQHK